ncbi:choline ABC transporter substrate-binding protein [Nocardioides gansuensis]|uniref:Choline ABC transporter substrate-binding protein n=1 Tax=Nocardioides gansuensis TaxID=2138300 RepID=A0A2T8F5B6_9ACTN|nr:ABC transporter substrate-binding protein [Nocardioides gansuensis]PVG80889.1 choline ABC transporter substrate-binding protein [Nocardioides gansuensis]
MRSERLTSALSLAAAVSITALASACASQADKGDDFVGQDGGGADTITLIEQPWVDLQVENEISRQLLEQLGYTVKIDSVSVELGAQALSTGDADAYLGNWWPSQEPTYGSLIEGGQIEVVNEELLTGTQYGPAVPGDIADELGISSLADLDEHAEAFDHKIYGIEPGSPGNETIQAAIDADAYGLGDWTLVESGAPAMLTQVQKAQGRGDAIVFLGWSPHWMTVEFDTVFLEDPEGVWGGAGAIRAIVRAGFAEEAADINTFFSNLTFTTDEAGQFYYDHDKSGQDIGDIAAAWIKANPDKVKSFLAGVKSADGEDAEAAIFG